MVLYGSLGIRLQSAMYVYIVHVDRIFFSELLVATAKHVCVAHAI